MHRQARVLHPLVFSLALGAWLATAPGAQALSADPLARVQAACALESNSATAAAPAQKRWRDLELFVLAEARDARGPDPLAAQVRLYLKTYYLGSPLLGLLPPLPEDTPALENLELDPEWSRLVRYGVRLARDRAAAADWQSWFDLVCILARTPHELADPAALQAFVQDHPEAPLAGWAVEQVLWAQRELLPGARAAEGFREFWAAHPGHPLGTEASEVLDVPWFSPERVAHCSALLPGWGEEILEPGLHASSQSLLSETVYLLGAVAFWAAAQNQGRAGNLTGALIFLNLLMLNHHSSADLAYSTASRRNLAERRRFVNERLDADLAGNGHFAAPVLAEPPEEPLARDLVVSFGYRWHGAADAWRGQSLVRDEQLDNLGVSVDWAQTFWDARWTNWQAGAGLMPHAQVFGTRAQGLTDAPWVSDVNVWEAGGALEAVGLLRWLTGGPWLQLRLGLGPGYRQRSVTGAGFDGGDSGLAWFGSAVLSLGGESGVYWQLGLAVDDSLQSTAVRTPDRVLTLPARGEEIQFGLGVHF